MKTKLELAAFALLLTTIHFAQSTCFAQGSLTPPGAPGPTMKSLDQIEARTAITNAGAVMISQPGSYYLTRNISVSSGDAITLATNGVTLDMNGFTIKSTAPSATGYAILINGGLHNLTIVNGFIEGGVTNNGSGVYSGPGFAYGISCSGTQPENTRVSGVSVIGCLDYGIYLSLANSTVVEACTVRTLGSFGIIASTIKGCVATDCGSAAIEGDQVSDSEGESTGDGEAIYAHTAQNCNGTSGGDGDGIDAYTAQNCNGTSGGDGDGIDAYTAQNCNGTSGGGFGIYAAGSANNCYGQSTSGGGIDTYTAQNCYGYSGGGGDGIFAQFNANNCYGQSTTGTGLYAYNASFCTGSRSGGTAIQATIASGCIALSGVNIITYKYNMP